MFVYGQKKITKGPKKLVKMKENYIANTNKT